MGKTKFSCEESRKIINYIRNWRKHNENAVEWPLSDIRRDLEMSHYSREQIRNKIATLQKSEKIKGSPNYDVLCLRQGMPRKVDQRPDTNKTLNSNVSVPEELEKNLDVVRHMFQTVDPRMAFGAWFQLDVHTKANLGKSIRESWNVIKQNWNYICAGLTDEHLNELKVRAQGTKFAEYFDSRDEPLSRGYQSNGEKNNEVDSTKTVNGSGSNSNSDSFQTSSSFREDFNLVSNSSPKTDHPLTPSKSLSENLQIPFKFMLMADWTFPKASEREPSCSIFCQNISGDPLISDTKWPALIQALVNQPNVWNNVTSTLTWEKVLTTTNMQNMDPESTKMEFFRYVLPKRENFFIMQNTKTPMMLNLHKKEAMNLVFYTLYHGKNFSEFQRLYDERLLNCKFEWHKWIFAVKAKIYQDESGDFFRANEEIKAVVEERLYALIFQDGMKKAYKTTNVQPIIERLIRSIYANLE